MIAFGKFVNRHLNKYWKGFLFFTVAPWILVEVLMALSGRGDFLIVLYTVSNATISRGGLKVLGVLFGFTALCAAILATQLPYEPAKKD